MCWEQHHERTTFLIGTDRTLQKLETLKSRWEYLLDLIKEVESIDGQDLNGDELDKWLVKLRLCSILRHRLEIGQEIFGSEDDVLIEKSDDIDCQKDIIPLQGAWHESFKYIEDKDKAFHARLSQIIDFPMGAYNAEWWSFYWTQDSDFGLLDKQDDGAYQESCPLVVLLPAHSKYTPI